MQQKMLNICQIHLKYIARELPVQILYQHTLAGGKHMFVLSYCILFEELVPSNNGHAFL